MGRPEGGQAVLHCVVHEGTPIEARHTAIGRDPDLALVVLQDTGDLGAGETLIDIEHLEQACHGIVAEDAIAVGTEPIAPLAVLEDAAHVFRELAITDDLFADRAVHG